jgi:DNA invertase Pin-like site-specific DNA recombinase
LVLEGTVAHLAQAAEEDRAGERVPGLPLVEPRLRASAQVDVAAAVRGRRGGRPPVVTTDKFRRARDLIAKGLTVREAAVRLKVGKTALYQALRTAQA